VEGGVTKDGKTSSFNGLIGKKCYPLFIKIGYFLGKKSYNGIYKKYMYNKKASFLVSNRTRNAHKLRCHVQTINSVLNNEKDI
jgi:hypothetical protein